MKNSSSRLLPTAASPTLRQDTSSYGAGDQPSNMHSTFESLNAREVSTRHARYSVGGAGSGDSIQVRIRGKNNDVSRMNGSITRTMDEMGEERKRKQEISKAANRLKMLEKLEEYRE